MSDEFKEIETQQRESVELKENEPVVMTLVRKEDSQYGGNDFIVVLDGKEVKAENEVILWGKSVLQTKLKDVKDGSKIRVTSLGEVKSQKTGRQYNDYKVEVAE